MRLSDTIETLAAGGHVDKQQLLAMSRQQDDLLQESNELLSRCYTQVGMHLGEDIQKLQAKLAGRSFNEKEFSYERHPDGQE